MRNHSWRHFSFWNKEKPAAQETNRKQPTFCRQKGVTAYSLSARLLQQGAQRIELLLDAIDQRLFTLRTGSLG